jgi:hypothetical protein
MIKRLVLGGLICGLLLLGFGEGYSLMPKITEQVTEVQYKAGALRKVLTIPNIIYSSDSLTVELTGAQKKKLFKEAVQCWIDLRTAYDSLETLIQQFEQDSLNGN